MEVTIRVLLVSKTMFKENNEWYVRLEFSQEKINPPQVSPRSDDALQSLVPTIQQIVRSFLPIPSSLMPRMILLLREDEWEKIENKPDIGDEIIIKISDDKKITIQKD